jgi:hypothetical protein
MSLSLLNLGYHLHAGGCSIVKNGSFLYSSIERLTFVSVPRPNLTREGHFRYKLAFCSWLSVSPHSYVLLFVHRSGVRILADELDQLYGPGRVIYAGPIKHTFGDVPYVDEWFRHGIRRSPSDSVCFINSDILLSGDWFKRAE